MACRSKDGANHYQLLNPFDLKLLCVPLFTVLYNPIIIRFDKKIIKSPFAVSFSGKFTSMVANTHINITLPRLE